MGFQKMSKDPCFSYYEEALKCLDARGYQKELCTEAFNAFNDCRSKVEVENAKKRRDLLKKDPLLGWFFRDDKPEESDSKQ